MAKRGRPPTYKNDALIKALGQGEDYAKAAKILGVSRQALTRRAKDLGLVWVPARKELAGEMLEITLSAQKAIDDD